MRQHESAALELLADARAPRQKITAKALRAHVTGNMGFIRWKELRTETARTTESPREKASDPWKKNRLPSQATRPTRLNPVEQRPPPSERRGRPVNSTTQGKTRSALSEKPPASNQSEAGNDEQHGRRAGIRQAGGGRRGRHGGGDASRESGNGRNDTHIYQGFVFFRKHRILTSEYPKAPGMPNRATLRSKLRSAAIPKAIDSYKSS